MKFSCSWFVWSMVAVAVGGGCGAGGAGGRSKPDGANDNAGETVSTGEVSDTVAGELSDAMTGDMTTADPDVAEGLDTAAPTGDGAVPVDYAGHPPGANCALDGVCAVDDDCTGGARCNRSLQPPVCQMLYCGDEGSQCSQDLNCAQGLHCNPRYAQCRAGRLGETCGLKSCMDGLQCVTTAIYEDRFEPDSSCKVPGQLGTTCETTADCDQPLGCVEPLGMGGEPKPSTCRPVAVHGQACIEDFSENYLPCADGLTCATIDGLCRDGSAGDYCRLVVDDKGQTTMSNFPDHACKPELDCVVTDAGCVADKPDEGYVKECEGLCGTK